MKNRKMSRPLSGRGSSLDSDAPVEGKQPFRGTVALETHGCKLNQADTEALGRRFLEAGYRLVSTEQAADVYVVNTCTVTHVADRKARQALRSAHRRNPDATIVATGCYAQRDPSALGAVQGVDLVVGNSQKPALVGMVDTARRESSTAADAVPAVDHLPYSQGRSRAMVKIQEGCNQVCAYCIVPKVRGRERSIPTSELVMQVQAFELEGYREVVLTGTQLGSYGFDLEGENLLSLVATILKKTGIPRIRVFSASLSPKRSARICWAYGKTRVSAPISMCPCKAAVTGCCNVCGGATTPAMFAEALERIRASVPGSSVTTDVIVGFPGETDGDFDQGLMFAKEMGFASMHVFPYSRRPGTGAAYMGEQVDEGVKRERMGRMLAVAAESQASFTQESLGQVLRVLWERSTARESCGWRFSGLTDNYLRVTALSHRDLVNEITWARLDEAGPNSILCSVLGAEGNAA